ncbi:MAG: hypothetical protein JXR83_10345 [Deltaproteobacteria bacterium]|nr:hypothetical protein [Deltaproteobacteria bacterium]
MISSSGIDGRGGLQITQMLTSLGLPTNLGDLMGTRVGSAQTQLQIYMRTMGNVANFTPQQLDSFFGRNLAASQSVPAPYDVLAQNRQLYGSTYYSSWSFANATSQGTMFASSLQYAINSDPRMQQRLNAVAGGTVLADGRADGFVTVQRYTPYTNVAPYTPAIASNSTSSGIYGSLAQLENNILNLAGSMVNGGANSPNWTLSNPSTQQLAAGMGMTPPFAFEDLLYLMMMQYGQNKEKDIIGKMNELSQNAGQGTQPTSGYYPNYAGTGQVGNAPYGGLVGGPVGGTYAVSPQALTQYMGAQSAASSGATGATGSTSGAFGDTSTSSDTLKQMQLQKLMEDLKKMYEMLSNVMKSMHDMQMTAIRNLK